MIVKTYSEFIKHFDNAPRSGNYLFRGIGGQFDLLPSVAYSGEKDTSILINRSVAAQRQFNDSVRRDFPGMTFSDYQLTFLGRHCGLISPFIDFSLDDTIAIQFGIEAAGTNPVSLYPINISGDTGRDFKWGVLESKEFAVYRPHLVWNPNGFLTPQNTQLIQSARLISQPVISLATPFDITLGERIKKFVILPEDFTAFQEEILERGILMNQNLLIKSDDPLFRLAENINSEIVKKTGT